MCSISGIYASTNYLSPEQLYHFAAAMAAKQAHRGPDAQGVWLNHSQRLALSHRRLSIIDTTTDGQQPMVSTDDQLCITFNGEIYNYKELRAELVKHGVHFRTKTDTEVLLEAYRHFGLEVFEKLDGMYSFCIYDQSKDELLLARDPFGEKPLYYMQNQDSFAFASELSALEDLPFFDPEFDPEAIGQFLLFQTILAPRTIYRSVHALPPGSWMRFRRGQIDTGIHFSFQPGSAPSFSTDLDSASDELEALLEQSISRRLRSDVPIGFFLSGGIDSSLIAAISAKKLGVDLQTFSIGFSGASKSEHLMSRPTAKELQARHFESILKRDAIGQFFSQIGDFLDQPNGDTSCLPTLSLSRLAKQRVSVSLSGDGGDELFCGYNRNRLTLVEEQRHSESNRSSTWRAGDDYLASRFLLFKDTEVASLCRTIPSASLALVQDMRHDLNVNTHVPLVSRLRKFDASVFLSGVVLPKVDRMSMRYALEVRCPFLTRDLSRFAERIPPAFCFSNGKGKYILRHLINRYFPDGRLDQPKQGFGVQEDGHTGVAIRDYFKRLMEKPALQADRWMDRRFLREKIADPSKHGALSMDQCWSVLTLESWLESRAVRRRSSPSIAPANSDLASSPLQRSC